MARPDQEAIETLMSITGASELVAIQKLEEHAGNLNEAVDAHFSGDRNRTHETSVVVPQDDLMDIDDTIQVEFSRPPFSLLPSARNLNPFSLFDSNLIRSIFDTDLISPAPLVSHPREVREIPIEVKDGNEQSGHSGLAPTIQDVTGTAHELGPEIEGTVTIDEEDDEDIPTAQVAPWNEANDNILGGYSHATYSGPSAPGLDVLPDYGNDIEEEMIRAAIEASKRDTEIGYPDQSDPMPRQRQSHLEDEEVAHADSLSLKQSKRKQCKLEDKVGPSESEGSKSAEEMEAQLAAKEASLPHEPSSDDENAVTLLVQTPDGSQRGRRFL